MIFCSYLPPVIASKLVQHGLSPISATAALYFLPYAWILHVIRIMWQQTSRSHWSWLRASGVEHRQALRRGYKTFFLSPLLTPILRFCSVLHFAPVPLHLSLYSFSPPPSPLLSSCTALLVSLSRCCSLSLPSYSLLRISLLVQFSPPTHFMSLIPFLTVCLQVWGQVLICLLLFLPLFTSSPTRRIATCLL